MPHLTPSTTAALLSLTSLRTLKILEPAPLTTPHSLPAHTTPSFTSLHALTIGAAWSPTVRMLYSPYAPLLPGNLQLSILRTNRRLKHLSLLTLPPQEVLLLPRTLETLEVLFPTDLQVLSELDLPRLHSVRISGVRLCVREVRAVARMAPALVEFLFMGWDTGEEREPGVGDVAAWKAWRDRVKRWVCANDKTLEVLGASIDVKFDQYSTEVWCEMGKAALQELRETVLEEPVRATGPEEQMKETGLDVMEKPMKETPLEEPRGLAEEICFH